MMRPSEAQLRTIRGLHAAQQELNSRFVGRDDAVRLLVLAMVAREHLLLIGPPGTAKTELVNRFAALVQAKRFSHLLNRFTEPSEIFGPLDFEMFQQGTYRVKTDGMLPSAEVVFLDEVFQGSSAILNTLLSLINERRFHNGSAAEDTPLASLFGASSELPDDPALTAFSDRFLLRLQIDPVGIAQLPELLEHGWEQERTRFSAVEKPPVLEIGELRELSRAVGEVDVDPVRALLTDLFGELLAQGVRLSDRRIARAQRLIAAAALLREDGAARPRDLWPVAHLWTAPEDAALLREVVAERVALDGGRATAAVRSAERMQSLAEQEARRVIERGGVPHRGTVVAALKTVNTLLTEAMQHHPSATGVHAGIRGWRERLASLLIDEQP